MSARRWGGAPVSTAFFYTDGGCLHKLSYADGLIRGMCADGSDKKPSTQVLTVDSLTFSCSVCLILNYIGPWRAREEHLQLAKNKIKKKVPTTRVAERNGVVFIVGSKEPSIFFTCLSLS
jgi:hypothetical protein